jgi:hypothetical protein
MDSKKESVLSKHCLEDLKEDRLKKDLLLIKELHVFFKEEISLEEFQTKTLRLIQTNENFLSSLLYVRESGQIKTDYSSIRMVLLFVAIEALMSDSEFISFNEWLVTTKDILGKKQRDKLLKDINIQGNKDFTSLIKKLANEYYIHYGVTNKVRNFFVKYLDNDSKKKLIYSVLFYNNDCDKFVYKCFKNDKCLTETQNDDCYETNTECILNNEDSINDVLIKFVGFIYNYYRNSFVHEGKQSIVTDDNNCAGYDYYDKKYIEVHLSYGDFKEIVIKGIKRYYLQH